MKEQDYRFQILETDTTKYPIFTITMAVVLMLLARFTTSYLALVSFFICVYRVVRFDAKIFAVDYCILMPMTALMKLQNGTPLAIYLTLFAGIWYLIRGGVRVSTPFVVLLVLLNYLMLRMQLNVNDFMLFFGNMFVLVVLLPQQDQVSAERAMRCFCLSLLISSVYAYALRNTASLADLTGANEQPMWGTNLKRFEGLMADPNYYMTMLITGLALLLKLKDTKKIHIVSFWIQIVAIGFFGVVTYSKTFFLMLIFLVGVYVIWQFWNKKVFKGLFFSAAAVVALFLMFTMENSPFAAVLNRLTGAQNLSQLTTSRTDLYLLYWGEITENLSSFFFGKGLAAQPLYRDPHNVYIELCYYVGFVGMILFTVLFVTVMRETIARACAGTKENWISKYMILISVAIMYIALQGIFIQTFHAEIFLALISIYLTKEKSTERMICE